MGYLSDHQQTTTAEIPNNNTEPKNMGAKAPILRPQPPPRPARASEPYRPASASRLALRPDRFILNKIRHFCTDQEITLTHFFEVAALEYLKNHQTEYGRQGAKAPQIERFDLKSINNLSSIAEIYAFWTAAYNRHSLHYRGAWRPVWTDRDKTLEHQLRDIRREIIEIAILTVLSNKTLGGQRINSFQYYFSQIKCDADTLTTLSEKALIVRYHTMRRSLAAHLRVQCPTDTLDYLHQQGVPDL